MRSNVAALVVLCGSAALWPAAAGAQLIDAGNQAMIQHQGNLLQQQTAPNNRWTNKRPAPADRSKAVGPGAKPIRAAQAACSSVAAERERLRPEYERRVRHQGRPAADAWLRGAAADLGRQTAHRAKSGRC